VVLLHIAQLYHEGLATKFWSLWAFFAQLPGEWAKFARFGKLLLLCGSGAQEALVIFDALALLLLEIKLYGLVQRRVVGQEIVQVFSNLVVSFANPVLDVLELNFFHVLAGGFFADVQRRTFRNIVGFVAS
jgi:hypothetical protein